MILTCPVAFPPKVCEFPIIPGGIRSVYRPKLQKVLFECFDYERASSYK